VLGPDGQERDRLALEPGRCLYHVVGLPASPDFELAFHASRCVAPDLHPGDDRELALKIYEATVFPARNEIEVVESGCWRLPDQPPTVFLELTARCNLACLQCSHAIGGPPRQQEDMTPEMVERLVEYASGARTISLHGIGEPLLYPGFSAVVEALRIDEPRIFLNCNGTLLKDEHVDLLLGGKFRELSFSLDAATAPTYRLVRGADLTRVLDNIRRLLAERNRRGLRYPEVYINMTLLRVNLHEAPLLVELGAELGVDAVYLWNLIHDRAVYSWTVERDGHVFDYDNESANLEPERVARILGEAHRRARELGLRLVGDHNRRYVVDESGHDRELVEEGFARTFRLRDYRGAREVLVTTDGRIRMSYQHEIFTRTLLCEVPENADLHDAPEHLAARYLLAFDRVPAAFRNTGNRHLEGNGLHVVEDGIFVVGRHASRARGLRDEGGESPARGLPFRWTGARVEVEVSWEQGKIPFAAQIYCHTPDLGQAAPRGRLLVEGHVVFEGALSVGTWSRDVLLSEDLGKSLVASDSLQLVLEVEEDAECPEAIQGLGAGLIALAVV